MLELKDGDKCAVRTTDDGYGRDQRCRDRQCGATAETKGRRIKEEGGEQRNS